MPLLKVLPVRLHLFAVPLWVFIRVLIVIVETLLNRKPLNFALKLLGPLNSGFSTLNIDMICFDLLAAACMQTSFRFWWYVLFMFHQISSGSANWPRFEGRKKWLWLYVLLIIYRMKEKIEKDMYIFKHAYVYIETKNGKQNFKGRDHHYSSFVFSSTLLLSFCLLLKVFKLSITLNPVRAI